MISTSKHKITNFSGNKAYSESISEVELLKSLFTKSKNITNAFHQ